VDSIEEGRGRDIVRTSSKIHPIASAIASEASMAGKVATIIQPS
jgi:hypothetical protein